MRDRVPIRQRGLWVDCFSLFKHSTEEKDMLLHTQEMAALECMLKTSVDSLKKEMALMQEEAAQEWGQQGAIEEVNTSLQNEMAALPGAMKEEKANKEKDKLLREAQAEVA